MPIQWSQRIVIAELGDEPELSEELAAIFDRLKSIAPGAAVDAPVRPPSVVLNFSGVTYLNSSHIAAILRLRKKIMEAGRKLVLCSLSDELWSVILMTGLDRIFVVAPDTSTALARIQIELASEGEG